VYLGANPNFLNVFLDLFNHYLGIQSYENIIGMDLDLVS